MKRACVLILALAVLAVGAAAVFAAETSAPAAPAPAAPAPAAPAAAPVNKLVYKVGETTPSLMGKTLEEKEIDLKTTLTKDKNLLVFFNTSCRNCMMELDYLQRAVEDGKTGNVVIAAVGVDIAGVAPIKRLKERRNFKFDVYSDPDFSIPGSFGLSLTPSAVIIDKEGKILEVLTGYDAQVKEKIASLFK